jgi:hypothetical protein
MSIFKGTCPECKLHYYGEGLSEQTNQFCLECGRALKVSRDRIVISLAFSTFRAEEYKVELDPESSQDLCSKNLLLNLTLN